MTLILGAVLAIAVVAVVFRLVAHRRLLVKYAVLWVGVAAFLAVLALFPPLLRWLADLLGFEVPSNMLFFAAIILLLAIALQLSVEVSRIERRLQRVAEELALMGATPPSGNDTPDDPDR